MRFLQSTAKYSVLKIILVCVLLFFSSGVYGRERSCGPPRLFWRRVSSGPPGRVAFLSLHPTCSLTLAAATKKAVYVSYDGAKSWSLVLKTGLLHGDEEEGQDEEENEKHVVSVGDDSAGGDARKETNARSIEDPHLVSFRVKGKRAWSFDKRRIRGVALGKREILVATSKSIYSGVFHGPLHKEKTFPYKSKVNALIRLSGKSDRYIAAAGNRLWVRKKKIWERLPPVFGEEILAVSSGTVRSRHLAVIGERNLYISTSGGKSFERVSLTARPWDVALFAGAGGTIIFAVTTRLGVELGYKSGGRFRVKRKISFGSGIVGVVGNPDATPGSLLLWGSSAWLTKGYAPSKFFRVVSKTSRRDRNSREKNVPGKKGDDRSHRSFSASDKTRAIGYSILSARNAYGLVGRPQTGAFLPRKKNRPVRAWMVTTNGFYQSMWIRIRKTNPVPQEREPRTGKTKIIERAERTKRRKSVSREEQIKSMCAISNLKQSPFVFSRKRARWSNWVPKFRLSLEARKKETLNYPAQMVSSTSFRIWASLEWPLGRSSNPVSSLQLASSVQQRHKRLKNEDRLHLVQTCRQLVALRDSACNISALKLATLELQLREVLLLLRSDTEKKSFSRDGGKK